MTPDALADLDRIAEHIEADNPARAISFVEELREVARRLADLPQGFPLVPRYERYGIRRRSYRRYGILYRPEPERTLSCAFLAPARIMTAHYSWW
ncbi:MAG: type II toxin-antitoxin system RelE/ParE family toxin [Sphingomicrobium sp.]